MLKKYNFKTKNNYNNLLTPWALHIVWFSSHSLGCSCICVLQDPLWKKEKCSVETLYTSQCWYYVCWPSSRVRNMNNGITYSTFISRSYKAVNARKSVFESFFIYCYLLEYCQLTNNPSPPLPYLFLYERGVATWVSGTPNY